MASDPHPHVVQDSDMSMWDDPSFNSLYDNFGATVESPFDGNRLFDLTAVGAADSPNFAIKSTFEEDSGRSGHQSQPFHSRSLVSSRSAESSSQDSASETSGRKRQNTSATSESPPATHYVNVKMEYEGTPQTNNQGQRAQIEGSGGGVGNPGGNMHNLQSFGRSMHALSLEPEFTRANQNTAMNSAFDFDSAASSPGGTMDMADATYTSHIQARMKRPPAMPAHSHHDPPVSARRPRRIVPSLPC